VKQIRGRSRHHVDYDRREVQERLAKLVGGSRSSRSARPPDRDEGKKARVEERWHATRRGGREGIVPGGGVALLRAVVALEELKVSGEQQYG